MEESPPTHGKFQGQGATPLTHEMARQILERSESALLEPVAA